MPQFWAHLNHSPTLVDYSSFTIRSNHNAFNRHQRSFETLIRDAAYSIGERLNRDLTVV